MGSSDGTRSHLADRGVGEVFRCDSFNGKSRQGTIDGEECDVKKVSATSGGRFGVAGQNKRKYGGLGNDNERGKKAGAGVEGNDEG